MLLINEIVKFKKKYPFLSQKDISNFLSITDMVSLKNSDMFLRPGEIKSYGGYVLKGLLRCYYLKEDGTEITIMFCEEGTIVGTWETFLLNKPSELFIQAIEPTVLLALNFSDLQKIIEVNHSIARVYIEMSNHLLANTLSIIQSLLNEKPEIRYKHFINNNLTLLNRISQKHLASYLGITAVSLSRLRKRIKTN